MCMHACVCVCVCGSRIENRVSRIKNPVSIPNFVHFGFPYIHPGHPADP